MLSIERSVTTLGIYLRSLRTIVNIALRKGLMEKYPFGKDKDLYKIKNPPARKMALTPAELKKIFDYQAEEGSSEQFYTDLWKFSYLCAGMNVKDICLLKNESLVRDKIMYKREKTSRSDINGREIIIPIGKEAQLILDRWGNSSRKKGDFVFPIIKEHFSPEKTHAEIRQTIKQINKYIRRVCDKMKIEMNVTTYSARHSYATHMMRHGAPTEFISKQLGHTNIKTTISYLENFEERQLKEWQDKTTDFNL